MPTIICKIESLVTGQIIILKIFCLNSYGTRLAGNAGMDKKRSKDEASVLLPVINSTFGKALAKAAAMGYGSRL
jgi:hypothetical protein